MDASEPLRPAFRGPLHLPGEAAYDAHRATWSGSIDPRPAVVAEAATPSDVRAAVLIAREHGLPFAVQSTGHGTHVAVPTAACCSRPSRMAEVLVDPDRAHRAGRARRASGATSSRRPRRAGSRR